MTSTVCLCMLALLVGCGRAPVPTALRIAAPSERTEPIDLAPALAPCIADGPIPGLAAAVVEGGVVVARGVAGFRAHGRPEPVLPGDRFHIASCTKSMTAMAAAVLVEEGRLSWATTVARALPEHADGIRPEYRGVTLIQLLAHAGRLPPYTGFGPERAAELRSLPGPHAAQREAFVLEVLRAEAPIDPAGDGAYSNAGYALAGVMIERAAGEPWEEVVRGLVLTPLGMASAGFGWPTQLGEGQPAGHFEDHGRARPQPPSHPFLAPCLWPAGGVSCSIDDLSRYAADHLNGLQGRPALLRPGTYRTLHGCPGGEPEGFTLGWGVRVDPELGAVHFGAGSGGTYFVRIWIVPSSDMAVVVACNSGGGADVTAKVIRALIEEYGRD